MKASDHQPSAAEADFTNALIQSARNRKSWRERLQWIRDCFTDPAFAASPEELAAIAIYLRFLATGELKCEEDGRHFRPNHHAEAALKIESALERLSTPTTAWILRRIYPYLPAWGEEFRRSEPLTRIRDIAHRNDIPAELKNEIKRRLQNKLHRCAGPEDLRTSEEILRRITAPGASHSSAFVQEFQIFHAELSEFFNAADLQKRLQTLARSSESATAQTVNAFLAFWQQAPVGGASDLTFLMDLLDRLTTLRKVFTENLDRHSPQQRSQLRLADIALEDHAFAVLSECNNRLSNLPWPGAWTSLLRVLLAALANLHLCGIEPEECSVLHSELSAWADGFSAESRFNVLRVLATLARARRLAENYTDRINQLFTPRVEQLGQALGVAEHAVKVFSEGDVRGHVVFQLSRLVDLGLRAARDALRLPPWESIVPGKAAGMLIHAASLMEVEAEKGPLLLLLDEADGDAEIPACVKGVVLGHPMPHLSHLGVRARQARIPFAACIAREHLDDFVAFVGKQVSLRVSPDGASIQESAADSIPAAQPAFSVALSPCRLVTPLSPSIIPLDQAAPETCGAKAATAQRLLEMARRSDGLFRAPRGLAIPFGVMERCLEAAPAIRSEVHALQERLSTNPGELEALLGRLRELIWALAVPETIEKTVIDFFGADARLAVRSSANGEDLEHLAGAGLYASVVNVSPVAVRGEIVQVWSSLWTRRATLSRQQAGIPHDQIHMAVLLQELVSPEVSFIMHTVNPLTLDHDEILVELAVGLGEVIASSPFPGTPYRLAAHRKSNDVTLHTCANFSIALRPSLTAEGPITQERLDYSRIPLSADQAAAQRLGIRLARIANFLEDELGLPQDVEGVCVGEEIHLVQTRAQQGL